MEIKLQFEKSDLIGPVILNLCSNTDQLLALKRGAEHTINLGDLHWANPLSILPIASLLFQLDSVGIKFDIVKPYNVNVRAYLDTICFYQGVHSANYFRRHRNYIPIVSLSNVPQRERDRNEVLFSLLDILLERIGAKRNLVNSLGYAFSEMFDNIWEHSQTSYGWFLAQHYQSKEYADICFLDNGITIKGAYNKKRVKAPTDAEAIELALGGRSTKTKERGFGLRTTKRLVTESSLRGGFLILSGGAGYYATKNKEILFKLDCYWKGTIVLLRIHKTKEEIQYARYLE